MMRATMSLAPPAGKHTIQCTGRAGQFCARAMRGAAGTAAADAARCRNVRRASFMGVPLCLGGALSAVTVRGPPDTPLGGTLYRARRGEGHDYRLWHFR